MNEQKITTTDIILNDKELETLIRQLDEQEFSGKVEDFLKYYENDLISLHDDFAIEERHFIQGGSEWHKKRFFEKYYQLLCSMYAVFKREDNITQKNIVKFAKEHFNSKFYVDTINFEFLYCFIFERLRLNCGLPQYSETDVLRWENIDSVKEFCEFKLKCGCSSRGTKETSLAAIWLIQTYF